MDNQEKTIAEDFVVTKYKMAGDISNRVIQGVIAQCVAGVSVLKLCTLGDGLLLEETAKVLDKEKEMKKGIAFPTCVSVNNCVCHFSPLASDTDVELKDGDVVKIDLGAHVDGFIASVAHTVVVGSSPSTKITGRKADILLAAHYASEAAFCLMKPGTENQAVTNIVQTIAKTFNCQPIIGMLSHQLKQFEINGEKTVIQNPNENQRKEHEKSTFELHEVYAIDVVISSGEGVVQKMDTQTTVFKKTNEMHTLKKKASRALLEEVNSKCGTMPFCLRHLENEKKACMGVPECASLELLQPYHVLYENPNEIVAQFKFTVLLMPNGPQKINGLPFDPTAFKSDNGINDEEVKKLITSSTPSKPKKKKKPATTEVEKAKTEEYKPTKLRIPKLEDAHFAGTPNSIDCTLILTEGDSVKAVAVSGLEKIGREKFGVFPLHKNLPNVREASQEQILRNVEINNLMKILGLEYGIKYESVEDLKSLRYGRLMIMSEQDPDGVQFKGLVINFLHLYWPSLLRLPFLDQFIIPVAVAKPKFTKDTAEVMESLSFYSLPKLEDWMSKTKNFTSYGIKHYKGLGSLSKEEARAYFSQMDRHRIYFHHDGDRDDKALIMAYDQKHISEWKYRVNFWKSGCKELSKLGHPEEIYGEGVKQVSFYDFVHKDLIRFNNLEYERSVPSVIDGFTRRHRKILYTCIKRDDKQEVNVAVLAGSVAEHSAYPQPALLFGPIIELAQDFIGSNNLNFLLPNGQFGTRHEGGKDFASPPFISTAMSKITRIMFRSEDDSLLEHRLEGNKRVEPEHYVPVIPTILVNGIGTGSMLKKTKFNPKDIIENVNRMLDGQEPIPMNPWFKGFSGLIERIDNITHAIYGAVAVLSSTELEITELPIGISTQDYKESVMENMLHGSEKIPPLINDYKEYHTDSTVRFVVSMSEDKMQQAEAMGLHETFKLKTTLSRTPTELYDSNGLLRTYESDVGILKEFYKVRLEFYEKRRLSVKNKYKYLLNQCKLIRDVCNGALTVDSKQTDDLLVELRQRYDPNPIMASRSENYEYLLAFFKPPYNLTRGEKAKKLLTDRFNVMKSYRIISEKSPEALWREDLSKLSEILPEPATSEAKPTSSPTKKKSRQDSEDEMLVSEPKKARKQHL